MPSAMPIPKCTILIAEDTEDVRRLIKLMLELKGCRVLEAAHGKEAIELTRLDLHGLENARARRI